jgi:transcriptional regulator GlxA family with amidase domain
LRPGTVSPGVRLVSDDPVALVPVQLALQPHHLSRVLVAAVDLMMSHCRDPLTVDEVAHRIGVSQDHLIRIFRQAFGLPAATYYVRLRIAVACRLLSDTDARMHDVAHQVGYRGAANLSRAFKEVMGIRPGEYRRSSS